MFKRFERRNEEFFKVHPYIAEFWNIVLNAPLTIIGLLRYMEHGNSAAVSIAYLLMAAAGVCSAIHHATAPKWTIVIDWIPIASLLFYSLVTWPLTLLTPAGFLSCALTLLVLWSDHIVKLIPVPWGHVMWHLLAALAVDAFLQNMEKFQ